MITCPFCNEDGFDLIGLRIHLVMCYCDAYNNTPMSDPPKQSGEFLQCVECGKTDFDADLYCLNCGRKNHLEVF